MSLYNIRRPAILLALLQTLAIITLAHPFTNPVSLLNTTIRHTASTSLELPISQNGTTSGYPQNTFDYRIVGTPVILRITEVGLPFSPAGVGEIIDSSIQRVVRHINRGAGKRPIENDRFDTLSREIVLRITGLENAGLTYFLLGKQSVVGA